MTNITHRFNIGDTIYSPTWKDEEKQFDCPDCLGTKKWEVVTPAGSRLTTECARCQSYCRDLPRLKYNARSPAVNEWHVTGITLNLHKEVEYHSGTASSWRSVSENNAYATREEALAVAQAIVLEENAKILAKPALLTARHVSGLKYEDARFDEFKNSLWYSWYAYNRLKEDVEAIATDEDLSRAEIKEKLGEILQWEKHSSKAALLVSVVSAVAHDVESGTASAALKTAFEMLPKFTRAALSGAELAKASKNVL